MTTTEQGAYNRSDCQAGSTCVTCVYDCDGTVLRNYGPPAPSSTPQPVMTAFFGPTATQTPTITPTPTVTPTATPTPTPTPVGCTVSCPTTSSKPAGYTATCAGQNVYERAQQYSDDKWCAKIKAGGQTYDYSAMRNGSTIGCTCAWTWISSP